MTIDKVTGAITLHEDPVASIDESDKIISMCLDREHNNMFYLLLEKEDGEVVLNGFRHGKGLK